MNPFSLLSTQTRITRRPPRLTPRADAALINRLVPGRIQPRQAAQALQPANSASQTTPIQKNGRKSPLAQAPSSIIRFPTSSTQLFGPTSNGNLKAQTNGRVRPIVVVHPNQAVPNKKDAAPDVPLNLHKPTFDTQQAEESEKERTTIFDAPDNPGGSQHKPKTEERAHQTQPVTISPRLRLKDIMAQFDTLPSQAVILGICDDGLPLALDLSDAAPGAVLSIGDTREEQIALLRTAVASICSRNSPRGAQFLVFSHQPESWQTWISQNGFSRHCIAIENAQEGFLQERILQLVNWAEQRRLGQLAGPPVLLVIDTLMFLPRLEYEIRFNLDWLIKEGPQVKIWTIATISTELASSLGNRMLRSFQSRILGCTKDPGIYSRLVGLDEAQASWLAHPGSFIVQVGENWLKFHLPGTEN